MTPPAKRNRRAYDLSPVSPPLMFATVNRKPPGESSGATPTHVVLAAVLQVRDGTLQALLWERAREPFAGCWALPGGYLAPGETLEASIRRHLAAKVDVRELSHLEQLDTRSDPKRVPGEWQLATTYLGLVPTDADPRLPADTAWHPVNRLPQLAFDHGDVHDLPAPRPLRRGPGARGVGDEPAARPAAAEGARTDRRHAPPRPERRPPRRALPLPDARARGHRRVRRPAPTPLSAKTAGPLAGVRTYRRTWDLRA